MKFSIALGLLFAGLANSQLTQPRQASIDGFLRESQHLKPSAQLVSISEHGPIATVTYQDGPVNFKYDVKSDGKDMKIVGIERVMTFSGNFQFNPTNLPTPNIQIEQLPPLPLIMPQFTIQSNGQVGMRNVFDRVEKQIMEMQQRMQHDRLNIQNEMERKRQQMRENFNKKFNIATKETPLIGEGDHDMNWATSEIEIQPNQPLIGGGDHDTWSGQPVDFQAEHPLVGGDGHDSWQEKKKKCKKNLKKDGLIGGDDHDNWKNEKHMGMKHHKKERREKRHHSNAAWMNKQFSAEEITPYLKEKIPDLMSESQIVLIQHKGFEKGKGFKLDIQLKDQQGELQIVSACFKPMKKELSIEKISKVRPSPLETGKQILVNVMKNIKEEFYKPAIEIQDLKEELREQKIQETQNLIARSQIPEEPKQFLLGGSGDPDHDADFMKMPEEIQVYQNNHISEHREDKIDQVPLPGGETVPDNVKQQQAKQIQISLSGGKQDPDQKIDSQSALKQALKIIEDILEEESVEDIDEVEQEFAEQPKEKRSQIKEQIELLTHRR